MRRRAIHYSKFDEKEYAKLHRPLYPAHHTNIAMNMKFGLIKGRLASHSRHITERHDFMRQAAKLAKVYMGKQYNQGGQINHFRMDGQTEVTAVCHINTVRDRAIRTRNGVAIALHATLVTLVTSPRHPH